MKKKVINIILISLLALCGIAYLVCYLVIKEDTINFTHGLVDFINRPLPIVGVSLVIVAGFIFKFISMSSWGKKQTAELKGEIAELKNESEKSQADFQNKIEEKEKELAELEQNNQEKILALEELLCKVGSSIPNKKVNNIVKEYEDGSREENINSQTKSEETQD